jgi:Sugar phosphate permease
MASEHGLTGVDTKGIIQVLLLAGVFLSSLAEALTGTALSLGRLDMMGDLYTTPDEFAWLDIGYIAAKLCGFMLVPALFARFKPIPVLLFFCGVIIAGSVFMACSSSLFFLIFLRIAQGLAGGVLLVGAQSVLFNVFNRKLQPLAQLVFALGAVVAPATFASLFLGLMVDFLAWEAIFFVAAILALIAFFVLSLIPFDVMPCSGSRRRDLFGFLLFAAAAACLTYIAQEGSRWNWFEANHIIALTVSGFTALLLCVLRWSFFPRQDSLVCLCVFGNLNFCFGFLISFVAGMALFGSTTMIPGFTLNTLHFTATEAGTLNAAGGIAFCIALILTVLLLSFTRVNPLATVPFGILLFMVGMWQLSGSTSETGSVELFVPILIRGAGLGFLFLSLTIFTLENLTDSNIAQGVALFTTNRQLGGLFGVAMLQRYMDHQDALNISILSSHMENGSVFVAERLQVMQAALQERGMEAGDTARAAMALLHKNLQEQSSTISFNEVFFAIILIFVTAIPFLILFKIWLSKYFSGKVAA